MSDPTIITRPLPTDRLPLWAQQVNARHVGIAREVVQEFQKVRVSGEDRFYPECELAVVTIAMAVRMAEERTYARCAAALDDLSRLALTTSFRPQAVAHHAAANIIRKLAHEAGRVA